MKLGSLFAGIGGFDLAAREMGWTTAWFSEIEPYASKVLAKHWPGVPNHGDIRNIRGKDVEHVDILCGGFPCQDISVAGTGRGLGGDKSGLWAHYARLIGEIRPKYVLAENSPMLRSRGLGAVLKDLHALGYDAEWHCVPASSVGAPHRRDRIWILAYANGQRELQPQGPVTRERGRAGDGGEPGCGSCLSHANGQRLEEQRGPLATAATYPTAERCGGWPAEPNVGRVAHGVPARVDRLRCLGNAIVPQVALGFFKAIAAHEGVAHA